MSLHGGEDSFNRFQNQETNICELCLKPELDYRNEWLWELCSLLFSQARIAGGMGAVFTGFDLNSLHFLLIAKDIPRCLWEDVLISVECVASVARKYVNAEKS